MYEGIKIARPTTKTARSVHVLTTPLLPQPCIPYTLTVYCLRFQSINSIDRALLNEDLLEEAVAVPNVKVFFKRKVLSIDFDAKTMVVKDETAPETQVPFDFCIGADGSYSIVRRQLMRVVRYVPCSSFLHDSLASPEYSHR